jgi:predicted ATPase
MIDRIYVDNYKCLVNSDIDLKTLDLFLGDSGTGKTAIFESLLVIKSLAFGEEKVNEVLPTSTLTRWQNRSVQTFELTLRGNEGEYKYHLEIDHSRSEDKRRIKLEKLTFNEHPLFEFEMGDMQLHWDDFREGPAYPFDWERSALPTIMPRNDTKKITWFKRRLEQVYVLRLDPYSMKGRSEEEESSPSSDLSNFASWYRHLSQENPNRISPLFEDLEYVIDGFDALKLPSDGGEKRTMKVAVDHQSDSENVSTTEDYAFDELSEGQRASIVLYSLLHFLIREDVTLCIDEPENFLALAEIQPWLMDLAELCSDEDAQALLISHHPEFINLLALEKGTLFERPNAGPVRTSSFKPDGTDNISPSELVARGWHNE